MRQPFDLEKRRGFSASMRDVILGAKAARGKGDKARDRGDWVGAKTHYRRYLASFGQDAAIWVQLGHALKESGNLDEAESAYRAALRLLPEDEDIHLQIGHLMKVIGRIDDAAESYAASARVAKKQGHAVAAPFLLELHADREDDIAIPAASSRVLFPIGDLLYYLHHHLTVSGIQRVQLNVINYLLEKHDELQRHFFVYSGLHSKELLAIAPERLRDLAGYLGSAGNDHHAIRRLIAKAQDTAVRIEVGADDICFILGSFWDVGGNSAFLREVKRRKAKLGIYFYDLIPVTHREYVVRELSVGFAQALIEALSFIDFGLAISDYTAKEVVRFIADKGLRPVPITTVPLAHSLRQGETTDIGTDEEWPEAVIGLRNRNYVLCVSTIEARKNHRYLFDVWNALIADGVDPPVLLLVGRQGWLVDDLMRQLEATHYLDGRIKIVHDVSDEDLAQLYRYCLFTVFPSVVEGWGLPVGESLSYGKLCVASSTTSVPEVGGDLVAYIDPWNVRDGIEVLRTLLASPPEIARREQAIRENFIARGWSEVGKDILDRIAQAAQAARDDPVFIPFLSPGTLFFPGRFSLLANIRFKTVNERQQSLILGDGWDRPEKFGVWMKDRVGRLSFKSTLAPLTEVTIYLHLAMPPATTQNDLVVKCGDLSLATLALPSDKDRLTVRIESRTDAEGDIHLQLDLSGPLLPREGDERLVRVGLVSLAYAGLTDRGSRADILEALLIDTRYETA